MVARVRHAAAPWMEVTLHHLCRFQRRRLSSLPDDMQLRALHRSMLKRVSLVAAPRREVHVYGFGDDTRSHEGLVREAAGPARSHGDLSGSGPRYGSWGGRAEPER